MDQRALGKEDRIERSTQHGREGDGWTGHVARQTPQSNSAKAATINMAVRVTGGVKTLNFHQKASHSITSGG